MSDIHGNRSELVALAANQGAELTRFRAEVERLRAAWLLQLAAENECYAWVHDLPKPCDAAKCGCNLELGAYVAALAAGGKGE